MGNNVSRRWSRALSQFYFRAVHRYQYCSCLHDHMGQIYILKFLILEWRLVSTVKWYFSLLKWSKCTFILYLCLFTLLFKMALCWAWYLFTEVLYSGNWSQVFKRDYHLSTGRFIVWQMLFKVCWKLEGVQGRGELFVVKKTSIMVENLRSSVIVAYLEKVMAWKYHK